MKLGELREQLDLIAATHGNDTSVYIDAPGVTTPDFSLLTYQLHGRLPTRLNLSINHNRERR